MTRTFETWADADVEWRRIITPMSWEEVPSAECEREAHHRAGRATAKLRLLKDYRWQMTVCAR